MHIDDEDLLKIMEGKLNMMSAFTQKKLKITGNMSIAMKLNQVFASVALKSKPAVKPPTATSSDATTPSPKSGVVSTLASTTSKHKSGVFFDEVESKIKQEGAALVAKVGSIIGFEITCPDNQKISYAIDLKNAPGSVSVNDGSNSINICFGKTRLEQKLKPFLFSLKGIKPGCTILIGDEDLLNVMTGKLNMMTVKIV